MIIFTDNDATYSDEDNDNDNNAKDIGNNK